MTATPAQMADFVRLSVAMTGIAQDLLAPAVDPFNMKQLYFDTAQKNDAAAFQQLLGILAANPGVTGDALANLILNGSGDTVRYLGRAILLMWYFGAWYAPADLQKNAGTSPPPNSVASSVISADAYTQGWIWSVAQAHPMGYSNFRFGYWNTKPPSLSDFIGGSSS
jgi:hypothetical protein